MTLNAQQLDLLGSSALTWAKTGAIFLRTCRACVQSLGNNYLAMHGMAGEQRWVALRDELDNTLEFLRLKKKFCECGCVDDLYDEVKLAFDALKENDYQGMPIYIDGVHGAVGRLMERRWQQ